MRRAIYPTGLFLALCCCSVPQASQDSEFLQRSIVPHIGSWASGSETVFSLADEAKRRGYEVLCLAPEYYPLHSIEKLVRTPIDRYHSDFGSYIPENRMALIAVQDGHAHAALLNMTDKAFRQVDFEHPPKCVEGRTAALERTGNVIRLASV